MLFDQTIPGARPTNDISIEFEIGPKFAALWFKMSSTDHNEILHTSPQCNCRDLCKISLWSVKHILNYSIPNFYQISNLIEISLVGQAPGLCLNIKMVFPGMGIPMLKIRQSWDLIFNMEILILVRRHLYIETAPWILASHINVVNNLWYLISQISNISHIKSQNLNFSRLV